MPLNDTENKEHINWVFILNIAEAIAFFGLGLFFVLKVCIGGFFVLKILYADAVYNILISALFMLGSTFCCFRLLRKEGRAKRIIMALAIVLLVIIALCISRDVFLSDYQDISNGEATKDYITLQDIAENHSKKEIMGHASKRSPFISTEVYKVEQLDKITKEYYVSERIVGPSWLVKQTYKEMLLFLEREYNAIFNKQSESTVTGTMSKDDEKFLSLFVLKENEIIGIFVENGDEFFLNSAIRFLDN